MKETPWENGETEALPKPKKEKAPPALSLESVIGTLEEWENGLLKKPGQQADQDYAQVRVVFVKIGERVGRLLAAAHQNRCAHCKKPLPARGPVDTIPRPAPETALGWVNQFACSFKCAEALREAMHDREIKRLAEAS